MFLSRKHVTIAGSDLDGDEYSVIWDQELMIDRNEKPNDFVTRALMPEQMDPECLVSLSATTIRKLSFADSKMRTILLGISEDG